MDSGRLISGGARVSATRDKGPWCPPPPPTGNTHPQRTEQINNKYKLTLTVRCNANAKIPNFASQMPPQQSAAEAAALPGRLKLV